MTKPEDLIDRYFVLATSSDTDAYFAQFAPDATVEDEGHTRRGLDAIRSWRGEVPPVSYAVRSVAGDAGGYLALAEVSGDFPGSPVQLGFRFTFTADGRIQSLVIRP